MTISEIIFTAEGSTRYHRARAAYFSSLNRWLTIVTVFLGTGVFVTAVGEIRGVPAIAGIFVAIINVYKLVAKPDQCARDHERWCREWADLLASVRSDQTPEGEQLRRWIARVHELNSACFEDMKAVKAYVFNETMTSLGRTAEPYKLTRIQQLTKHIFPHTHSFDEQNLRSRAQ